MRIVVCDAGPVLHLTEAGALDLLERAGEVIIPAAVDREIVRHLPAWPARRPSWIQVRAPSAAATEHLARWATQIDLGPGEMEAIVLARSLRADWLLTDDAAARVIAGLFDLEVHGSLGVVLWGAAQRHVTGPEASAMLDRLAASSLWVSPAILAEARRALEALLE